MRNNEFCIADPSTSIFWYDFYVAKQLKEAFEKNGFKYTPYTKNLRIYLLGFPVRKEYKNIGELDKTAYNIAWVYGHPALIKNSDLSIFKRIFVSSCNISNYIAALGYKNIHTPMPTNKTLIKTTTKRDIAFLGSARYNQLHGRKVIADFLLESPLKKLEIRGYDLNIFISSNSNVSIGPHVPYEEISEFFASSKIVLHDHHPDMRDMGMVSHKLMDIIGSGAFVVSDNNKEIKEYMPDITTYQNPKELYNKIDYYLNNNKVREETIMKCMKYVKANDYQNFVNILIKNI
jgi:spore maturation protein CgeB